MRKMLALLVSTCLVWTPASFGQDFSDAQESEQYVRAGMTELQFSAALVFEDADNSSTDSFTALAGIGFGYMLADVDVGIAPIVNLVPEFGAKFAIAHEDVDISGVGEIETTVFTIGPELSLNFTTGSPAVPFLKVSGGPAFLFNRAEADDGGSVDEDEVGAFFQAGGGIHFFVVPSASLDVGFLYSRLFFDDEFGGDRDLFSINMGFTIFFGGESRAARYAE